jgi:UDP-glucose 4-epimerase
MNLHVSEQHMHDDRERALAGQKVLVTGGAGFLGSHLCQRLRQAGCEVHATSRQRRPPNGMGWWQADLSDLDAARTLISTTRPDVIFHLAGSVGASPDLHLVLPTYQSLLSSTVNLLLLCAEVGCRRIVLTGSLTEPAPDVPQPMPSSPYAAAKWASSAYARMFHSLYAVPAVIVRPFMTYGPGQAPTKLVPSVIRSLLAGEPPKLSSGRFRADWVYVSDVIDGFIAAVTEPGIEGQTFDLGTGSLHSVRSLVEKLATIVGSSVEPQFGALPDRPDEREWAANMQTAARLGWRPSTSLEEGLEQTVKWYRVHGHASEPGA